MPNRSADRLRELTHQYTRRSAAETMAEIPSTSGELSWEAFQIAQEKLVEAEAQIDELRQENAKLKALLKEPLR